MRQCARGIVGLFARALLAFIMLPGLIALAVPAAIAWSELDRDEGGFARQPWGLVPFAAGAILLLWCVRNFYVAGKGTLAPWDPPRHLVTTGPYEWSRNPMYVGVSLMLCGWALTFASPTLWIYTVVVVVAFHLRVVFGEEPWLVIMHGAAWERYKTRVRRWL